MRFVTRAAASAGKVLTLAFISFTTAEFVLGASAISRGASLALTFLLYGGGVVFIREFARRVGLPITAIAILGLAYGLLEEGLTMQTLFSPTLFSVASYGGRALGVNWIWALWVLGYHVVYSVIIPIVLTEALFDERKNEPWLNLPSLIASGLVCLLAAAVLGSYFRQHLLHGSAPLNLIVSTGLVAAALVLFAGPLSRRIAYLPAPKSPPHPLVLAIVALGVAYAWSRIASLPVELKQFPASDLFIAASVAALIGCGLLLNAAARSLRWTPAHSAAVVLGSLGPTILMGSRALQHASAIDRLGQAGASAAIITLALVPLLLAFRRRRLKSHRDRCRVLVIGAGVAGPVFALFLKRAGYDVVLFESHAEPVGDDGGGLMIAPNGMAVLARLGLADAIREVGAATRSMAFGNEFGTRIASIQLDAPWRCSPVTLARARLNEVLMAAARAAEIPVRYSRSLTSVESTSGPITAVFEDGTRATADFIVGADGIHSGLRKAIFPDGQHQPRYTGFTNIGGFSPPTSPSMMSDGAMRLFFGAKKFLAMAPIRDGAERRMMWWTSLAFPDEPGFQNLDRRDAEALRDLLVTQYTPLPDPLPELVAASEAMLRTAIYDLESLPHWSAGRSVLIGDAAHAMPPHAGQGASMAIEDAFVLVRSLEREATVERAFARYERIRRPRVERIARSARKNGMYKVPASGGERRVRAIVLRLLAPFIGVSIRAQYAWR